MKSEADSRSARSFNAVETRFQGKYGKSVGDTLYQAYRPFFGRTLLFLALGLLGRLALLGNANLIGYWVDSFRGSSIGFFSGWSSQDFLALLSGATLAGFALTAVYRVGISRLSAEAVSRIYDETTYRTSRFPMSFFDRNPAGRVMTRFSSDYNNIFRIFGGPLAEFIGLVFDLLAMTILIGVASPWLLPFWFLLGALNYAVYRWHLPTLRRERRETALKRSPAIAHFAETAQGAATIRAFSRQKTFERRFSHLNDLFLIQRMRAVGAFVLFTVSMNAATSLVFLLIGMSSIWLVETGKLSIGAVGVAFAYLGLSTNVLQSFFDWLGQFEEAMTGLERMDEYLRMELEPGAKLPGIAQFQTPHLKEEGAVRAARWPGDGASAGASIEIRDLWMRYREDMPLVLQGVELSVKPGERLAVIGKTGSGKTSLVQALFRLYPIEKGSIRIGGADAESCGDLSAYRSRLAYITQEAALFLGSLRDNLVAPGTEATARSDARLIEALRRVQFLAPGSTDEEYRYWLDFRVEERGRNLSAGERQLVCMARCLLQDAPVVVLDEATSSVDPRSEEILTRATDEFFRGKTQILIAHRLSTIQSCDRVLWLQKGRVHRCGPPSEVLAEFERAELDV